MTDLVADRWILDRPNSYIGRSVPRPNAPRLAEGRGTFVDDVELGRRTGHAAFVRSPHAHARIRSIDTEAARAAPGVIAVVTGRELAEIHDPWVGVLTHLEGLKSAPQYALPLDTATWQGEAVAAVVAESRAKAEDAAELVAIDWEVRPAVTDPATALHPDTTVIHESLGDNLAWRRNANFGDVEAAYAEADHVIEETFVFARHTGVCVEPRAILADFNPAEEQLTVWHNTQCPAHDPEHPGHPLPPGRAPGARHRARRGRVVRDQGAYLCRRDRDRGALHPAEAPGQVRGGPHGELRLRHPRARPPGAGNDRGPERRRNPRVRDRRPDWDRPLFDVSAHERHRGEPDRQPDGRPLRVRPLPGAGDRRLPEQEHDVPVPGRRASHQVRGDRGAGGFGRAGDRPRPRGAPPPEPAGGRLVPVPVGAGAAVREPLPPGEPRKAPGGDGLRGAQGGARCPPGTGRPPRDRARELHRSHQPLRHVLRGGGRPHLGPGRRHHAARREGKRVRRDGGDRAGAGDGGGHLAGCGDRRRGPARTAQDRHRRHRPHALRGRHVGIAGGRHRRGGGGPGGPGPAAADSRGGRRHAPGGGREPRPPRRGRGGCGDRRRAHRPRRDRAHLLLPPRYPAGRLPGRARRDPALRPPASTPSPSPTGRRPRTSRSTSRPASSPSSTTGASRTAER